MPRPRQDTHRWMKRSDEAGILQCTISRVYSYICQDTCEIRRSQVDRKGDGMTLGNAQCHVIQPTLSRVSCTFVKTQATTLTWVERGNETAINDARTHSGVVCTFVNAQTSRSLGARER